MTADNFNVGAFVMGATCSRRALVKHAELFTAYADGLMLERGKTREAYLSHFVFGGEMESHFAANRQSVAGFAGPCWCRWLIIDIDRPDLAEALKDTHRLVGQIQDRYDTNPPVWFSGSKGFHVAVELAHNPPPAVGFHRVAKAFAEKLAVEAGVRTDLAVYDLNRIIRLPNTRHPKTGLFKRRIDADDVFRMDAEAVRRHAFHPAGDGIPPWRGDSVKLTCDWEEAAAVANRQRADRLAARCDFAPDVRAPKYLLDFLRFGVPEGERHITLFRCAAWMSEQGSPPSLVAALLTEPGCDVGLPPKDVERQIRCGIEHARRQQTATDTPSNSTADLEALERWCIQHEGDRLPQGAMDFPFGALAAEKATERLPL